MIRLVAALLVLLGAATQRAGATILFAGGEDIDFSCGINGGCAVYTNTSVFRSAWAREAYLVGGSSADPPTSFFATPAFAGNSTLWVHAQLCLYSGGLGPSCNTNVTTANAQMLRVIDSAGNPTLIIRGTGSNGQVKISSRTASGIITDLATCPNVLSPALAQVDLYINYQSSGGEITLYANSNGTCDYTGNVTNGDGATTLTGVQFASPNSYNGNNSGAYWSEVIVATTDTRAMNLYTLAPNGNGNATQWSNSSGTAPCTSLLGQTSINDANYVYTATNSQIEECTVRNSIPIGNYDALALVMSGRLLVGASGPQHFDFVTRTGGSDYLSSDLAPTNSFNNINNYIQAVNPATGNPWAMSDFTAAGFNIGLESKP
jgi:hypothetical protein